MNDRAQKFLPIIVIVLLGFACYGNALRNEFVWDDDFNVVHDRFLRSWTFLPRVFVTDVAEAYSPSGESVPFYRPAYMVSLLVDYQLWGPRPFGFHLTNLLWHVVDGLLVYALLRTLKAHRQWALLGAAVFVCHPVNTETVAYVAGRSAEMCSGFMLASLLLILRLGSLEGSSRRFRWMFLGAALAAYALALLSKEVAVTFPAIVAAAGWLLRSRGARTSRTCWAVAGLSAVLALGYVLVRELVLTQTGFPAQFTVLERCSLALRALATTVALLVAPANLHHTRALPTTGWPATVLTAAGAILVAAGCLIGRWAYRREPRVSFGLLFFAVAFSLTSNLVPLNTTFGERWIGWPMVGLLISGSVGLENWTEGKARRAAVLQSLGWIAIAMFSMLTIAQNRVWHDDRTLYETLLERGSDAAEVRENLAFTYLDDGDYENARHQFEAVLERYPRNAPALRGMGILMARQKDYLAAREWLKRAHDADPADARTSIWLSSIQEHLGDVTQAEQTLRAAAALRHAALPTLQLAKFYYRHQRFNVAESVAREVLAADPMHAAVHNTLGMVLFRKGDLAGAERHFQLALRYDRWMADAHANLAAIADAQEDLAGALREYDAAIQLAPGNADYLYGLANVLARHGQTDRARQTLRHALEIDPGFEAAKKLLDQLPEPRRP
ncbi:MAG TPA: tetratricopeptide repeat protein [Verrucomicrobiae bacterium]|nr:tetratricopeptide repeat protein [Verrucomicrobiae bacterium]